MWRALAWLLSREPVRRRLIAYAKARPMNPLYLSGQLYMERYWLLPRWCLFDEGGGVLQTKPWCPVRWRIHCIHLPDNGRHKHDHPATYRTFILDGWYRETWCIFRRRHREAGGERVVSRGMTAAGGIGHYHDISEVSPGGVWTLFCMGKKAQPWGFLVHGEKVPAAIYRDLYR